MNPLDIVPIPTRHGIQYTLRFVFDMWVRAGRPPINSAGRLYAEQKGFWDARQAYIRYLSGGPWAPYAAPADNPDAEASFRLPHCRFIALDVDAVYQWQMRMAGFLFPLDGTGGKAKEPWHGEAVTNIYAYPIIRSIPANAGEQEPFTMGQYEDLKASDTRIIANQNKILKSLARVELQNSKLLGRGTGRFFKHAEMPKGSNLWMFVTEDGDFVRIRDQKTALLYRELNGNVDSQPLSGEAMRLLRDDLIRGGGQDLGAVAGSTTTKPSTIEEILADDDESAA